MKVLFLFQVVADYFGSSSNMVFRNDVIIYWPGNDGPPKNIPICGFMGDNPACKKHGKIIKIYTDLWIHGR